MELMEIRDLINSADPNAKHYDASHEAEALADFTVWMETERIVEYLDDVGEAAGWRFDVARFTRAEYDPLADAIEAALLSEPRVACKPRQVNYYIDSGYIRHTWTCEGV